MSTSNLALPLRRAAVFRARSCGQDQPRSRGPAAWRCGPPAWVRQNHRQLRRRQSWPY